MLRAPSIWLGRNRGVAVFLGLFSAGAAWALACVGRRLDPQASPNSVVAIWNQNHRTQLILSAGAHVILYPMLLLSALGAGQAGIFLLVPFFLVGAAASVEMLYSLLRGSDPFGWLPREGMGSRAEVGGLLTTKLAESAQPWPQWARLLAAAIWTWTLGSVMLSCATLIILLFLFFLLLGAILDAALNGDRNTSTTVTRSRPRPEEEVPPIFGRPGTRAKAGHGGPFADIVVTIEGRQIKRGLGGPFADVLATIEGNEIRRGHGGPLADVLFTIEGGAIKRGHGGPFADTVAVVEGQQIKAGFGGPFADVLYTLE